MAGPTVKNSAYNSNPSNSQPRLAASRMFHWWRVRPRYHGCGRATVSVMGIPPCLRISRRASLTIETRRSRAALSSAVIFLPTGLMLPEPAGGDCAYYSMEGARQGRMSSDALPRPSSGARGRGGEGEDRTRRMADHARQGGRRHGTERRRRLADVKEIDRDIRAGQKSSEALNGFDGAAGRRREIDRNQHALELDVAADLIDETARTRRDEQRRDGGTAEYTFRHRPLQPVRNAVAPVGREHDEVAPM